MFPYNNSGTKYLLTDYVDQTGNTSHVGLYDSSGMINVTILESEDIFTGLYASNGSVNVVNGAGLGVYSPCGAYNVEQGGGVDLTYAFTFNGEPFTFGDIAFTFGAP